MKMLKLIVATGLGTGYAPIASGTFGTLVGIPVVMLLSLTHPIIYMLATVALLLVGIRVSDFAEEYYQESDSGKIVIDEIVGYMVTMLLVPVNWMTLTAAFFVFRFFDIVKFWPARAIDQGHMGGAGVMLDDVAAGLYGCILMQFIARLWLI